MARKPQYAVAVYQPLTTLEQFHQSTAKWRLLVGSNRSGKTLAAAVEFCRAVLGLDPFQKYPTQNGVALIIGLDSAHLGMLWRKLALPGAFFVGKTGNMLRALTPDELQQYMRGQASVNVIPSPPLLPQSAIATLAWRNKSRGIPHDVQLKNGWIIRFVTSQGRTQQGEHYDLVWIDEQISNEQFFWESVRGLVDLSPNHRSYGIWSATSQKQNPLLWELAHKSQDTTNIEVYHLTLADNPYIPPAEKQQFGALLSDVERQVRVEGAWALEAWRVYPEFDPQGRHGCEPFAIPADWSLYLAVDPGTVHCATVFAAVPPDQKVIYIYDELLLHNSDARTWGEKLASRPDAHRFEAWIIDRRAGRSRSIGQSAQVAQLYYEAAKAYGVTPRIHGPLAGWMPGEDNPELRREIVRHMLWATDQAESVVPGLKVFRGRTPNLVHQMRIVQFDSKNEENRIRGSFDMVDALEYLLAYKPTYIARAQVSEQSKRIVDVFRELHRRPNLIPNLIRRGA